MRLFADLNRDQIRAAAADCLAVLPLGATEQHGPHLPAGVDSLIVEALAREAAAEASHEIPVMVAPALPFGSSDHHFAFGATLSLSTETYHRVLGDLVDSLVRDGFTRIFLVNGHGGNHELAQLAARDAALRHPVRVAAGSYWTIAWESHSPGHAGEFETSLTLALRPDLVAAERPRRDAFDLPARRWREERHGFWRDIDGFTDSPAHGSAEQGEELRRHIVRELATAYVSFYNS
jgi:creatinine amidohydrolase